MNFKKLIRSLHLWLGLSSGLVVFILGFTGCIYAFSDEIKSIIYKERLFIKASAEQQKLPLSTLLQAAQKSIDTTHIITRAQLFTDPARTYQFRALKINPNSFGYWNYYQYYDMVYVNPYNAKVVHIENAKYEFFTISLALHMNLLLGKPVGHLIVQWSVIIFISLLLSGLILWWPKNRKSKQLRKSFTVKWKAKFKRLNYDLHNVPGFYSFLLLLVISLSGLVMSFGLSGIPQQPVLSDTTITTSPATKMQQMDQIVDKASIATPDALYRYFNLPLTRQATANVSSYYSNTSFYDRQVQKYDQYTGKLLQAGKRFSELTFDAQLKTINYDLHTGTALGLTGKLIAFLASLIAASLPITGLIIWLGKRKKGLQ